MNMPLLLFENQVFAHFNKEAIPKEKILQGREMDEPVAESSIGNSYEASRTRRRATIEASIKSLGTRAISKYHSYHTLQRNTKTFRSGKAKS